MNWYDKAVAIFDNWQNVVTGIGTSLDRVRYTLPRFTGFCSDSTLEAMYYCTWEARKVVEELPDAAFRQGVDVVYDGESDPALVAEREAAIRQKMEDLNVLHNYVLALYWGRLYGRGGTWLGVNDGQTLDKPLDINRVRSFDFIEHLGKPEFKYASLYADPTKKGYGEPETWRITRSGGTTIDAPKVHESRILQTRGAPISREHRRSNEYADASVLQSMVETLQRSQSNKGSVANMMTDASMGVIKIRDFLSLLADDNARGLFKTRMEIFDLARNSSRSIPLDADGEDFTWQERSFSGVKDILENDKAENAGAGNMPQTVLYGRSPAGLSATGESDIRIWYDQVAAIREQQYTPDLTLIIQLVAKSLGYSDFALWRVSWPSLWQESPKERNDRQKTVSETDQTYIDLGVLTTEEVTAARYGGGEWSDRAPQVDMEARAGDGPTDDQDGLDVSVGNGRGDPEAVDPQTALNGSQVKSMLEIVNTVAQGLLPRESGVELITAAYPVDRATAESIMGEVGAGFEPRREEEPSTSPSIPEQ